MEITRHLEKQFIRFPVTARIHKVSDGADITPKTAADIDYLNSLSLDEVDIIIPPQDPLTLVLSVALTVATTLLLTPKIPNAANRNIPESSPNNGLSSRTNEPRIGARRPSIFGTVNSVPDLLTKPYSVYDESGREVEYNYMFVSEGTITASVFKDGSTQLKHITGSSAELYHPGTSPIKGSPIITVGDAINEPFISARKLSSINGQTLRPPNKITTSDNIKLFYPNKVKFENTDDLLDKYQVNETLKIEGAVFGGTSFLKPGHILGNAIHYPNLSIANLPSHITIGSELYAGYGNDDYISNDIVSIVNILEYPTGEPSEEIINVVIFLSASLPTLNKNTVETRFNNFQTTVNVAGLSNITGSTDQFGNVTGTGSIDLSTEIDEEITTYDIIHYANISIYVANATELDVYNGVYTIKSVSENEIDLIESWDIGTDTGFQPMSVSVEGPRWTDYVIVDDAELEGVIVNLTASNGMYKDNGKEQYRSNVECVVSITAVDKNDVAIGSEFLYTVMMKGSAVVRDSVNKTFRTAFVGRCRVRMHRSSFKDTEFAGQVVDDVKWKDLYSFKDITAHDILDNTRIRTATLATEGALSLKQRKLIISDATRNLPQYVDNALTTELFPTTNAIDALVAIALDPFIGKRSIDELNLVQLYETSEVIKSYFSNHSSVDFSYTLDSSNLTFEDTFSMIAHSIFSRAYRRSTQHYLSFEKKQSTSTLLFNHRNKIPNSETRRVQFGIKKNADGATCKWIDEDGIERTVSVPATGLLNAIEVPLLGLNEFQATKHAWRAWNKARYQNLFTQFDATSEAALTVLDQRILVADNVSGETYDGEVLDQVGLNLELSQDVPASGWIHLQLPKAEIQSIKYTRQSTNNITLLNPTQQVLSTCPQNYARATYLISESSTEEQSFLLLERTGDKQFNMKLGNYDDRFYSQDQV